VLDGRERPDGEIAALAAVLERATEPARFDVTEDAVERELARVRPRLRRGRAADRRPGARLALAFGAVAATGVALLVVTLVRVPGLDVEGKALAALAGRGKILKIEERIEPVVPGTFPVSTRIVWLDPTRGLERSAQIVHGLRVEETLVGPGRFSRYLPIQNVLITGPSCRAFASGCADLIDPVAFYRRSLAGPGTVKAKREGNVYRLTFPVQELPDAVRIEQRVTIDAKTYLPTLIEWREQRPGGRIHAVSRIVIESVKRLPFDQVLSPFRLSPLHGARVDQRTETRAPLRKLGEERITLAEARQVDPPLLWFGPAYQFRKLTSIERVRWNAGSAYQIHYGRVTVWNYTNVIPPELIASTVSGFVKPIPVGNNIARFYSAGGRIVVALDLPGRSVAIVAPGYLKEDFIQALRSLEPLE
jgi:hypothetical protein